MAVLSGFGREMPTHDSERYTSTLLMRVYQLARAVRVPLQLANELAFYWANVHRSRVTAITPIPLVVTPSAG